MYRNLHIVCIKAHPELAAKLKDITLQMKDIQLPGYFERELGKKADCVRGKSRGKKVTVAEEYAQTL